MHSNLGPRSLSSLASTTAQYWKKQRAPDASFGGADGTGVTFLQARPGEQGWAAATVAATAAAAAAAAGALPQNGVTARGLSCQILWRHATPAGLPPLLVPQAAAERLESIPDNSQDIVYCEWYRWAVYAVLAKLAVCCSSCCAASDRAAGRLLVPPADVPAAQARACIPAPAQRAL